MCGSVIADAVGECGAVVPHVMSNCFPFLFCLFFLIAVCVLFPLRSVFHVFLAFRSHCDLAIAMVPLLGHPVLDAALLQDLRGAAAPPCNGGCAQQSVRYTTLGRNTTRRQSRAPVRRSRVTPAHPFSDSTPPISYVLSVIVRLHAFAHPCPPA